MCPTIEINICSILLIKKGFRHPDRQTKGSLEKKEKMSHIFKVGTTHININCRTHKAHRELKFGTYAN